MDIVKTKNENYVKILNLLNVYNTRIEHVYPVSYNINNTLQLAIKNIQRSVAVLKKIQLTHAESAFQIVNSINYIEQVLDDIHTLLKQMDDMPSNISTTALLDVQNEHIEINVRYQIIKNIKYDKIIHLALDAINSDNTLDDVSKLYSKYPYATNLYTHYLQYKLNTSDKESTILNYIECAKNEILKPVQRNKISSLHLQRFNLMPLWASKTTEQLFTISLHLIKSADTTVTGGGGYTPIKLKLLSAIFNKREYGLFVIAAIGANTINYDLNSLIHKKTVSKFHVTPEMGINADAIHKYSVINKINTDYETMFKFHKLGCINAKKWMVVRTLDGHTYDIMGTNMMNVFVDDLVIQKMERGPSPRINEYQTICVNHVASHLNTPSEIILNEQTPFHNISVKVSHQVIAYLDEKLKTFPNTLGELFDIVAGDDIKEIVSKIMIQSYEEYAQNDNHELASTFLSNTHTIINIFARSIKEAFSKSKINEFMFRGKTKHMLSSTIRISLNKIIKNAAVLSFDPKQDIYEKMIVKKMLLNIVK
jgi:hypothetical protein